MLPEDELVRFVRCKPSLETALEPKDVTTYLQSKHVLSQDEVEEIENETLRIRRVKKLLPILDRKLTNLNILIEALRKCRYTDLVSELENFAPENQPDLIDTKVLFNLTTRGKIPARPEVYVERTEILNKMKEDLRELAKAEPGSWLIIHGMSGCGKSVLAAECARDPTIIGAVFPQIYWLKFTRRRNCSKRPPPVLRSSYSNTSDNGSADGGNDLEEDFLNEDETLKQALNFLFQKIIKPTLSQTPLYNSVSDAINRLEEAFLTMYPRTLLILDDISLKPYVRLFSGWPCRFLVTTQDKSIVNSVAMPKRLFPLEPSGFTKQETFQAFSKWIRTTPEKLPKDDVMKIYNECKGHPFVISLIGSLLREHNNSFRWKLCCQFLKRRRLEKIKLNDPNVNYPYNSFADAAACCLNDLDKKSRERYLHLSIFPNGVIISAKVLSVLWNESVPDVEDIMDKLVERQLLIKEEKSESYSDSEYGDSYSIHDLLHHYIKTQIKPDIKKELHKRLVENYRQKAQGNWQCLPNDSYIYAFIGYHTFRSGCSQYFPEIYLNLLFLRQKLEICGPSDVLGDFVRYADFIGEHDKDVFQEFRLFLCRNAHYFYSTSTDLIQMALLEPSNSSVRNASMNILTKNGQHRNGRFYFRSLLESIPLERKQCILTCNCMGGAVKRSLWLPKSDGFVSCGADKSLKVCSSRSCCVFRSYQLPDQPAWFALSSDGDKALVACGSHMYVYDISTLNLHETVNSMLSPAYAGSDSQDRTPSPLITQLVWNHNISYHTQSSSSTLICGGRNKLSPLVTSSSSYVHDEERDLIDFSPGDYSTVLRSAGDDGEDCREILCCEISHDNCLFVSVGRDTKITLWSSTTGQLLDTFEGHVKSVNCCKFACDDSLLASCGDDGTVKVWDLIRRQLRYTFVEHQLVNAHVKCLCFVPGRTDYRTVSASGQVVLVWTPRLSVGQENLHNIVKLVANSDVLCLDVTSDGRYLATGLVNYTISFWNIESESCLVNVCGHSGWIHSVQFSPDGSKLLSASDDGTVTIWKSSNGDLPNRIRISQVYTVVSNEVGCYLIGADLNDRLVTMSLPSVEIVCHSARQSSPVTCLSFSPSRLGSLIVGFKNGAVHLCNKIFDSYDSFDVLPGHKKSVICVSFSQMGNLFASGAEDGDINVWKSADNRKPIRLKGHSDAIVKLKFLSESKNILISASHDGGIGIWSLVDEGKLIQFIRGSDKSVLDFDVDNAESMLCYGGADKLIKVLRFDSGQQIFEAQTADCVRCCRFSPSGCFVMTGQDDGCAKVWSTLTGAVIGEFKGHNSWINDAQFSSDDNFLVTVSNCLKFWSVVGQRQECLQTYPLTGENIKRVFAAQNFTCFTTVDSFGNVHMLNRIEEIVD